MLNVQGLTSHQMLRTAVADGDKGTAQTIPYAKQLIAEGMVEPSVRNLAVAYCANIPANDEVGEMQAVFNGVLRDFRFIKDPVGCQLLQPAGGVLDTRAGNCATLNLVLLPSLLGSIGYPTRAVTIKSDPERPAEYSHVYIEAQLADGQWVPLDVARSNPVFGKEPEFYWARRNWPLTAGGSSGAAFLNGYGHRGMGADSVLITRKRRFPGRGLGQDPSVDPTLIGNDWNSGFEEGYSAAANVQQGPSAGAIFAAATPSILGGVAQVVKAANTPNIPFVGVGVPATTGTGVALTGSSTLIFLALLGVGVAFAFAHK